VRIVRAFAFDLDGTILEADGLIHKETKEAFSQAASLGIKLIVATGRSLGDVYKVLSRNGLGSKIGFPHAILSLEHRIHFVRNSDFIPLQDWNDRMRHSFLQILPLAGKVVARMKQELEHRGFKNKLQLTSEEQIKYEIIGLIFESMKEGEKARKYIVSRLPSFTSELFCNRNGRAVHLKYREAGKGRALFELVRTLRIEPSQVLAVGNSQNDEDMLDGRYGFQSATVSNAEGIAQLPLGGGVAEILTRQIK